MRCILISLSVLAASSQLWAQDTMVPDFSTLPPIQRFAVDGLDSKTVLLGPAIDNVIATLGLPARIEIRKDMARGDIDLDEIPAIWIFEGFTVTTLFYRDCLLLIEETGEYGCGPYRDSRIVDRISVDSPDVRLAFGLRIGATIDDFATALGKPRPGRNRSHIGVTDREYMYRDVAVSKFVGRNIDITLVVDAEGSVVRIEWERASWH